MVAAISLKPGDPNARLTEALVLSLKRRQIIGSRNVSLATAALIQNIVRSVKYNTIDEILALIKVVGSRLVEANARELAAGNIVRRILRLIREEYRAAAATHRSNTPASSAPETPYFGPTTPGINPPSNHYLSNAANSSSAGHFDFTAPASAASNLLSRQTSLSNFVAMRHSRAQMERHGSVLDSSSATPFSPATNGFFMSPGLPEGFGEAYPHSAGAGVGFAISRVASSDDFMKQSGKIKPLLVQAIEEVVGELETTHEDVAKGAKEHIHSSEVILTLGHSKTVEIFLKQAARDRKFTVVIVETAPFYLGQSLSDSLTAAGIPTLIISDSALHAIVPRCTKLILGAHSVLANGGMFSVAGSLSAVLAARAHSKPVVVTTGQFKFAPAWNLYHEYGAVDFRGPKEVTSFQGAGEGVEVLEPYYDYIRPELINLFVTNEGDHPPSYIYRLIKEAYDDEDMEL